MNVLFSLFMLKGVIEGRYNLDIETGIGEVERRLQARHAIALGARSKQKKRC